ncbi:hypothetical protein HYV84_06315, partial [Candidatus Woesearchaeota archaeon]|nr:hypothetical protein [Candidatus Woesearchaeota archaeon]
MEKQDNFFRTKAENSDGPLQAIEKYKVLVKKWESHLNGLKTRHTQKNITDETYHALLIEKIEGKTRAEWLAHSKFLLQEAKKAAAELHLREKEPPTLFKLRVDSLKRTLRKKRIAAGEYLRNTITSKKDSLENSLKQGRETIAQELERAKSGIKRFVKHTIKQTAEHSKNAIRHFTRKSVPGAFSQKKLIQAGKIGAAALLLFAAFGLFSLIEKQASPTGFASMTQENSYTETVALSFSNTTGSPWSPLQAGPLTGLSVSGKYTKGSGFSLSLTSGNKSFLIFTDEKPSNEEIISFTAAPIDEEPPEPAVILETVPSGNESALGIILRGPEKTIKQTDEVFAFSAAPEPAPQLQADRLCAVWKVNNIPAACSGNSGCCSFVGIPLLDPETNPWNAPFYLTFGRFGASWENTLQSRLVYYDVNLSIPAADIRYSREVSVPANFEEATVPFSKSCLETCILPNLNDTGYTLNISITKGKLFLEQFDYRIAQEVSISSAPPQLDANISNITIYENGSQTLNLSRYFSDRDNDSPDRVGLTFTFTASDNISAAFKKNLAVLSPQPGFKGRVFAHIAASDGFYSTTSNVFAVEVIEKPFPLDEVTIHEAIKKPLIRINQPVKWVRQINSSGSVINLTIAIPSSAFNLSLRDVEKNKSISASKIIINESGTIKNLSVFNTEKRLGQIEELEGMLLAEKVLLVEKSPAAAENISSLNTELLSLKNEKNDLTGYVVSSRQNKGLLTIFYERLFGSE